MKKGCAKTLKEHCVLMWMISSFIIVLLGMGTVAFVTLLERKILGLSQIRLGPNKVTFFGLLQPVADGVKLLSKQNLRTKLSQINLFFISPVILFIIFLFLWSWLLPWEGNMFLTKHNSLLYFSVLGIGAYAVILTGWSSTSAFSKLGSMRGILQSLSYEVALIVVFVVFLLLSKSFNLVSSLVSWEILCFWIVFWLLMVLMESNRAPFDLLEGESELISGFNIEMGSLMFVYLFLSEYGMVIVMAVITNILLFETINLVTLVLTVVLLLVRSCFPRVRYDALMSMMWQCILPISAMMVFFFFF